VGVHFENCNKIPFTVEFINADLHLASFYQFKLPNTRFLNCSLKEVDFAEADLTNSVFENCDLSSAIFEQTILEKADLRTSYNFSIHPEINKIKKARFSLNGLQGLLYKYDIIVEG